MLPIALFRTDAARIREGLRKKHFAGPELVDRIIALDEERRSVQTESETLAAGSNAAAKKIGQLMAAGNREEAEAAKAAVAAGKERGRDLAARLEELERELHEGIVRLPNLPHASVPEGRTPEENVTVRTGGEKPVLESDPLPHWELARKFGLINFELGTKITGAGFPVYVGSGAKLQRALIAYFLDFNTAAGYTEIQPPYLVNAESAFGTGQLPDKEGQMYHATTDDLYLIPTAEVPVTNLYRDTIIETELPVKLTAYTPCFRREAGSYGKDVRGLNRVHQFDKVEIVQLAHPGHSYDALEDMVSHVERLIRSLGLHYRILRLCGGDMSFTSALTYDFEVWSPAQERWLEVSSVSNFETFQTGRMKIRTRDAAGKTGPVHSLNGSSLALPRILACLLEQYQSEEGIRLPEVLHPYFGGAVVTA